MEGKKANNEADPPTQPWRDSVPERPPAYVPRITTMDVLRRLIADDLRWGRLTPARCRALARYAQDFGISNSQTMRLIAECRDEALISGDPRARRCARRLTEPAASAVGAAVKFGLLAACLIALEIALLRYFSR